MLSHRLAAHSLGAKAATADSLSLPAQGEHRTGEKQAGMTATSSVEMKLGFACSHKKL